MAIWLMLVMAGMVLLLKKKKGNFDWFYHKPAQDGK